MKPLDLRTIRPRKAASTDLGIIFLARTIDKARASLPGGNLGGYRLLAPEVTTLSAHLLEVIGRTEDEFVRMVAEASGEDDIVEWIQANVDGGALVEWNAWASSLRICDCSERGRVSLYSSNPRTVDLPRDTLVLDALDYEDL